MYKLYTVALLIGVFLSTTLYAYLPTGMSKPISIILSGLAGISIGLVVSIVIFTAYAVLVDSITKQVQKRIDSKGGETHE